MKRILFSVLCNDETGTLIELFAAQRIAYRWLALRAVGPGPDQREQLLEMADKFRQLSRIAPRNLFTSQRLYHQRPHPRSTDPALYFGGI